MGSVYAVRDDRAGRSVALKYLKRDAAHEKGAAAALFQREYHTLAQLRHPRVIQVYDYGVDGDRPYYTMELLDGSDLRELAPVPWLRACQWLRDVASSLALLHSRRLLHRDLSPRNVRCTRDGQAKLIDFGAMTAMGPARDVAGTPPYMAPEAVHSQTLDARTDLYALGTLAYWTLTGYDAYPARDTRELRALWQKPVVQPGSLVRDIPDALDALVMSLLSLDPQARPSHVAEVLERLTAIAGLEPIEPMDVARAYVATPTLIGHTDTLASFHKRLVRAARGRGSAVFIEGAPGLGRTRLLEALALEAKLSGVLVLQADGARARHDELAVARSLLDGIVLAAPDLALAAFAPHAAVLGPLLPSLAAKLPAPEPLPPLAGIERIARLEHALHAFIGSVAERQTLMLAVDDIDEADEASRVSIAWLGREAAERKLVVCVTAKSAQWSGPVAALSESAVRIGLSPFNGEQTERLLRSVFGDASHLRAVAAWAHELSQGAPAMILELVQYLVDHRIARYERGSWTLPASLRDQPLPKSVEHAFDQLVAELSSEARSLAVALALMTAHGALELEEIAELGGKARPDQVYGALLELEAAAVVVCTGGLYALRRRGLERALLKQEAAAALRARHAGLAAIYAARTDRSAAAGSREDAARVQDESRLLAAHHWHLAGELPRSFDALCAVADVDGSRFGRTPESVAMHVAALEHAEQSGAPALRVYQLQRALVQLASTTDLSLVRHAAGALQRLCKDSGLTELPLIGGRRDGADAVREVLARARARYDAMAPEARSLSPARALNELGFIASVLAGVHVTRGDGDALAGLAALVEPLVPLTLGFRILGDLIAQASCALKGLSVLQQRRAALAQLTEGADVMDPRARTSAQAALTYWIAMDEALEGSPRALDRADELAAQPAFIALAARVRGVYLLFTGDEQGAEASRKQRETLALNDPWAVSLPDARGALYEAWGYYLCGSVLGLRRVLNVVSEHAARMPGWQSNLYLVRGLYELLRGESARAVSDLERSGSAGAHAMALLAADSAQAAADVVRKAFDVKGEGAPQTLFPPQRWALCVARALTRSELGEPAAAAELIARDIAEAEHEGLQGMLLCWLHEAAARIAIACDDRAAFRTHVRKLGATYGRGTSGLRARYEHLGVVARSALISVPPPVPASDVRVDEPRTRVEHTTTREQRGQRALRTIAGEIQVERAFLFGMQPSGLRYSAKLGDRPPPEGLEDMLGFYLNAELDSGDAVSHMVTGTFSASPDLVAFIRDGEELYFPVLLSCVHDQQRVVAGVAVLALHSEGEPAIAESLIAEVSQALIDAGDVVFARAAQ
jgi:hypothetical protein